MGTVAAIWDKEQDIVGHLARVPQISDDLFVGQALHRRRADDPVKASLVQAVRQAVYLDRLDAGPRCCIWLSRQTFQRVPEPVQNLTTVLADDQAQTVREQDQIQVIAMLFRKPQDQYAARRARLCKDPGHHPELGIVLVRRTHSLPFKQGKRVHGADGAEAGRAIR